MQLIQHVTVDAAGGASSITFSGIPQTGFTDLVLVTSLRATNTVSQWQNVRVTFNGSGSGYSYRLLFGTNSGVGSASESSQAQLRFLYSTYALATANTFSSGQMYIPNYRSNVAKSVSYDSVTEHNGAEVIQAVTAGIWSGTDAISSITLVPDFAGSWVQNTIVSLYGITAGSSGGVTVS
jgi:hypothetical protein